MAYTSDALENADNAHTDLAHRKGTHMSGALPITFNLLKELNTSRCSRWHPGYPDDEEWTLSDWSNALAGEVGEAANIVKKIRRIEAGNPGSNDTSITDLRAKLGEELADVVLYADLVATKVGLTLGDEVQKKFDYVSIREGFPERMR